MISAVTPCTHHTCSFCWADVIPVPISQAPFYMSRHCSKWLLMCVRQSVECCCRLHLSSLPHLKQTNKIVVLYYSMCAWYAICSIYKCLPRHHIVFPLPLSSSHFILCDSWQTVSGLQVVQRKPSTRFVICHGRIAACNNYIENAMHFENK